MATKVIVSKEKLDNLANAINTKAETSGAKTLDELILEVDNFQGGIDTSDATATSGDILLGKTAYVNDVKIEGTIETYDGSIESGAEVDDTVDRLIDGTLTELKSNATNVRDYAFQNNKNIKSVDFPNATSIGDYAFGGCSNLTSINAPNVTSLGTSGSNKNRVFSSCSLLKSIQFDLIEKIGEYCFSGCTALKYAKFAMVNTIYSYGFGGLSSSQGISNADLYFGYEDVVVLKDSYVFSEARGIKVHVRPGLDLATKYASATNWASLISKGTITIVEDYNDN